MIFMYIIYRPLNNCFLKNNSYKYAFIVDSLEPEHFYWLRLQKKFQL